MIAPIKNPLNKSLNKSMPWWGEPTFTERHTKDRHAPRHRVSERPLSGGAVFILGGGPSLTPDVGKALAAYNHSIAVNNSYLFYDRPALVVALDRRWWQWHGNAIKSFGHTAVTSLRPNQTFPIGFDGYAFDKDRDGAFDTCPGVLCGQNSGHSAINLAMHLGAERIYLAGFDMGFVNGKSHWHQGHNVPSSEANYAKRFLPALESLVHGAEQLSVFISAVTPTLARIPMTPLLDAVQDVGL